jgi:hypothetical protein
MIRRRGRSQATAFSLDGSRWTSVILSRLEEGSCVFTVATVYWKLGLHCINQIFA